VNIVVTSGHCLHAERVFFLKEPVESHVKPQNFSPARIGSSCHYVNHLENSAVHLSNVIIFQVISKTETKGRNIVNLINQVRTSEDENCKESECGEIQLERIVYVILEIY
jgi:hypothetical protein